MAGKLCLKILMYISIIVTPGVIRCVTASSLYPSTFTDYRVGENSIQAATVDADKPLDAILEAVMELGGSVLFLLPPHEFDKRHPPDLGTGRSFSGQHTAKVMWSKLASNSPVGPGRRKRTLNMEKIRQLDRKRLASFFQPEEV